MLAAASVTLQWMFAMLLGGALLAVILGRWPRACGWVCSLMVAAAAVLSLHLGAMAFGAPSGLDFSLARVAIIGASLSFHLDTLSIIFLWLILLIGLICTIYSVRYAEGAARKSDRADVTGYYAPLMLFLAGMAAVVCISDLLFFVAAWEFMSLPAYMLIVHDKRRAEALRAGLKYFIMTHVGNFGIIVAILLLYRYEASFSFDAARASLSALVVTRPFLANFIMALLALGFMTKAGIFPMGDWLPDAHPEAPSPVSALLSGVMIKLGAYGLIRFFLGLFVPAGATGGSLLAWGLALAGWGTLSIFLGGVAAVLSNDSKRLLAYSSISQAGYILLSLGVAIAFVPTNPLVSALAFVAAMVFILADGLHKALLFLSAGSVLHATGSRNLNELGGLGERMPLTAGTATIGALSVAGIPLTVGFIGKWLILQTALLQAAEQPVLAVYVVVAVIGSVLSLAYGLKYVGAAFLGPPAEPQAIAEIGEVAVGMRIPQMLLAAGCVLFGIWPAALIAPALTVWRDSLASGPAMPFTTLNLAGVASRVTEVGASAAFAPPLVLGVMAIAMLVAWGLSRAGGAPIRQVAGWQSGLDLPAQQVRLSAGGYYWPFTRYLARTYPQIGLPRLPELTVPAVLELDRWAFDRIARFGGWIADRLGKGHTGRSQLYVLWQAIGAAIVILLLAVLSR